MTKSLPLLIAVISIVVFSTSLAKEIQSPASLLRIKWSRDGNQLAISRNNFHMQIINFAANTTKDIELTSNARLIEWSPNDQLVAIYGNRVEVRDAVSGNMVQQFNPSIAPRGYLVNDLSWSPDGSFLAVALSIGTGGSARRFVLIWDIANNVVQQSFEIGALKVKWHPTLNLISQASSSYENRNSIIDLDLGTIDPIFSDAPLVSDVAWSPDGTKLALSFYNFVGSDAGNTHLAIWNLNTQSIGSDYEFEDKGIGYYIESLQWGPDSRHILIADRTPNLYIWDSIENHVTTDFAIPVLQADWSPDGSTVAYFAQNERRLVRYIDTPQYAVHTPTCTSNPTTASDLISDITTANGTPEPDTICLTDSATYTFTTAYIPLNALPVITSDITICSAEGATLTRQAGAPQFGFIWQFQKGFVQGFSQQSIGLVRATLTNRFQNFLI